MEGDLGHLMCSCLSLSQDDLRDLPIHEVRFLAFDRLNDVLAFL